MHRRTSGIGQVLAAASLVFATLAAPSALAAGTTPAAGAAPVPGAIAETDQVVIRWAQPLDAARSATSARVAQLGAASGRSLAFVRRFQSASSIYRLPTRLGAAAPQILAALARVPGVASVEADPRATADALPNDPYASQLWGLLGPANGSPYGIDAPDGWSTTQGSGVTVAVIDTGITAHPDLVGQTVAGYDFVTDPAGANDGDGRDPDPSDPGDWISQADASGAFQGCTVSSSSWHGTHVAGTIAALANNSTGVFGGAPLVKIEPVRVLGKCGGYFSDIEDAIAWASGGTVAGAPANLNPARVLNLSLGGAGVACDSTMQGVINGAIANGSIVVVAAGNSNTNVSTSAPANCAGVFSVAATDVKGQRASFSNYGSTVSIAAPGVGIWSTLNDGATVPANPAYANYSGTSMATPHVALTAALLAAAYPLATSAHIEAAIRAGATAFPTDSTCISLGCGAGIDNVPGALAALAPPVASWTPPASPTNAATLSYGLTFSKPVSGLAAGDFAVAGSATGCAPSPSGSGTSYTVSVGSCSSGTVTLTLKAGAVTDALGNAGPTTDLAASTITIDRIAPTAIWTPPASPTNAATLSYDLTFSTPVTGLVASDFAVTGSATGCAPSPSGSAASYTVSVESCTNGTVSLTLKAGAVTDALGDTGPAADLAASTTTIDRTPPGAVLTAPATPTSAPALSYAVAFSEPVGGLAASDFAVTGSATGCLVGTPTGSAASYAVDLAGCSEGTVILTLGAGRVADGAGNAGPVADVVASTVTIDRTGPTATLVCTPGPGPTKATSLACSATFSELPGVGSAFGAADVLVGGSTTGWVVSAPAGSGTGPYAFSVAGGSAGGTLTVAIRAGAITDGAGNPTTASATLVLTIDRTSPTASAPTTTPRVGVALAGSAIPVQVAWSGKDNVGGTGVARYELARSVNGGTWVTLSRSLTSPSFPTAVAAWRTVRFRVRSVDRAGNGGAWMTGPLLTPRLFQQTAIGVRYAGAWYAVTGSAYSASSARYARAARASVTYVITGRSMALVTTKAPSRGKVRVYVNGVLAATVDLSAATTRYRVLAWQRTWSTSASRTIRLVVVGTPGRPRVDLDAFAVLR